VQPAIQADNVLMPMTNGWMVRMGQTKGKILTAYGGDLLETLTGGLVCVHRLHCWLSAV